MNQRTALVLLGRLGVTLVASLVTRNNALVRVMGVALLLFLLSQKRQ